MPQPFELRRDVVGSTVLVSYGGALLAAYDRDEQGMRNFAIVSLTRAGRPGVEIAKLFGVRPEHVSRLRRMADEGGASALVPTRGRPRALKASEESRIYVLADEGRSGVEIARMMGVSAATISRRLARRPQPVIENPALEFTATDTEGDTEGEGEGNTEGEGEEEGLSTTELHGDVARGTKRSQISKISAGEAECGYTGAMLLHSFFDRAGANTVLGALPSAPARRYDAASLMLSMTFGFALGASSAEGTKHLLGTDAGALVGLESFPHLRTLRPRLCGLAEAVDPLEIQSALAKHMLAADDLAPEVFFVDDHFVAYTGSADVAKGWNTRRRLAEAGRDDTFIVDDTWRAICFSSGPPSGLSKTMWAPLDALQEICSKRPITIGFDRGGSYPKVFAELELRGHNWITYRRAPLARPTVAPRRCSVVIDGDRHYLTVADEIVELENVGDVRQISIYEAGKVVLQILTSDLLSSAAVLAHRLRGRWCIENSFKYLEDHHGIHWLCDYRKDIGPDESQVTNPKRTAANKALRAAEAAVSDLERAIGTTATTSTDEIATINGTLARLTAQLAVARKHLDTVKAERKAIPAKVVATDLDPDAKRATLLVNRRALQMVCRLLAYNAELDLARALNAYLADPDEYRSITRHLLHQPGHITYTPTTIAVTIRRPDAPRIARALTLLITQLNTKPPHLPGDTRPITYHITAKP